MARIRSVKPELRTSEVVASWPREVRYFFVLLWGYLDDKGRGLDVPKTIAGDCFPHDDDVTPAKVNKWLALMTSAKTDKEPPICRYEVGGRKYLHALNWREHQKPNRPSPSRLPPCPLHEGFSESFSESGNEPPPGNSLPGAEEQQSRGAEEQQQSRSEPRAEPAAAAAAAIITDSTDATPAEAQALLAWIERERRPRNLGGLVRTLQRDGDLQRLLDEQRVRDRPAAQALRLAAAERCPKRGHEHEYAEHCRACRSESLALTGATGAYAIVPRPAA